MDRPYRRLMAAAVACAGLMLGACSVGPRYIRPNAQVPPAYKESASAGNQQWQPASPSEGSLRGNWWELFGDPQLNRLEQLISSSNQNIKQAEAQFREARTLVALDRAQYFPTVTTQPALTSSYQSANLGTHRIGNPGIFTLYSLPFSGSWEPDFWGRISLSVQNAGAAAQASAADLENIRLSFQAELAVDYFQMEALDMNERLLEETIAGYEKALQLTIYRFNGGVASKVDVSQAQTQLDTTRAQLTDLGVGRAQFEHAIAVLAGEPPSSLSLAPGQINGVPPPVPAGVPSQLLERRPDIASAERKVAAANAEIGLAKTAFFPSVALTAAAGLQSGSISSWLNWPSRFFSVGPSMAQTLLDFGRRRAGTEQVEAAYDAAVASYRQTVLAAFQEVEDNLAALRVLAQEAAQQDAAVKGAQVSLQLEMDRYKAGNVSYLDVITSQTIALTSERAAVDILERRMTATVQLIRALGGGWDASSLPSLKALGKADTPAENRK